MARRYWLLVRAVPGTYIVEALITVSCDDHRYRDIRLRRQTLELLLCMDTTRKICGHKASLHASTVP